MSVSIQGKQLVNRSDVSISDADAVHLLGPMDHLFPFFITTSVLFVYKRPVNQSVDQPTNDNQSENDFMPVDLLRQSMQRLLQHYPHLVGRVRINEHDKTPQIHHRNTGALLITAKHSATLAEATNNTSPSSITVRSFADAGTSLQPPRPLTPGEAYGNALFAVQHTRFACGSVCLGIRIHHWVTDGEGFFQIARDLAAHFRNFRREQHGLIAEVIKPPHNHAYLTGINQMMTDSEKAAALEYDPSSVTLPDPAATGTAVTDSDEHSNDQPIVAEGVMQSRILRFSAAEMKALKTDVISVLWVSSFEALAAHIHFHVYHARLAYEKRAFPNADHTTRKEDFMPSMNWRSADRLDLPPRYALNAVLNVALRLSPADLQCGSAASIAQKVHEAYQQQTRSKTDALLRWVAAQPDKSAIVARVQFEHTFILTPWNKLGMYRDLAFEEVSSGTVDQVSSPILVSPAFDASNIYPRLCIFLEPPPASHSASGSDPPVDVCLSLPEAVWLELDSNSEFRKFSSL